MFTLNWISVHSSNLVRIAFDSGYLYITFKNGETYSYENVPIDVYLDLLGASSKGKYHHAHIKWVYSFKRISA